MTLDAALDVPYEEVASEITTEVHLPPKLIPIFTPARGSVYYRAAFGGRGSGKSFNFALMAAIFGYAERLRILCTREYQVSIRESFYAELKAAIESHAFLADHYIIGVEYIRGKNGTEFFFRGLRHGMDSIKSLAKIDLTIVEEAETVPEGSWLALLATVMRQPKAEVWAIWNPRDEKSPVHQRFRVDPSPGLLITEINYNDNPFFPPGLDALRESDLERLDFATYEHIWLGAFLKNSSAQVLHGKYKIMEFEPGPDWHGPYQGGDWGFSQDPTAGVRLWVHKDCLYFEYSAGKVGLELDDTNQFFDERIPGWAEHNTRWDNARPESISHIRSKGAPRALPAAKWPGSVKDGIAHYRSYKEIIIHPRCEGVIEEVRLWSYKVDRLSGEVTSKLVDANNHYMDAGRYALGPLIKKAGTPELIAL